MQFRRVVAYEDHLERLRRQPFEGLVRIPRGGCVETLILKQALDGNQELVVDIDNEDTSTRPVHLTPLLVHRKQMCGDNSVR
jgi:hypothetical protein